MNKKYTDEFKLLVIKDYYESDIGVRAIARKYNLPSKNYINNWENQLKRKGLLPEDAEKPNKTSGPSSNSLNLEPAKTPRERELEIENMQLRARIEYFESLDYMKPFIPKKKIKIKEFKYQIISKLQYKYPIGLLCELAGVSRTSYYKYINKPAKNTDELEEKILKIYEKSKKRFGYRSITDKLKEEYNLVVNHKKVLRIMRELGIKSIVRRKKEKPVDGPLGIKENLLQRNFTASKRGEKYVTDITYIPTKSKMMYMCVIIDLFDGAVVSKVISDKQDKWLTINTVRKLNKKVNLRGAIIHSDQGTQYRSIKYIELLEDLGVKQSMSRKGNCWDNAKAENFFSHFKCEELYLYDRYLIDYNEVLDIANDYINYYNTYRPQKRLGGLPPAKYIGQKVA